LVGTSVLLAGPAAAEASIQGGVAGVFATVRVQDARMERTACADAGIDVQLSGNYKQVQVSLSAETPNSGESIVADTMGYDSDNSIQDGFSLCPDDFLPGIYTVTGTIEVDGQTAPLSSDPFEVTSTTVKFANTKAVVRGRWQSLGSISTGADGSYAMTQTGGIKAGAQVKVVFEGNDNTTASTTVTSR
jgi:hypothetical protein